MFSILNDCRNIYTLIKILWKFDYNTQPLIVTNVFKDILSLRAC